MNTNGTCKNLSVKIQKGGTCWFHGSLNGWILSERGRRILKQYLNKFKQTPNYAKFKQYENLQACPMRGKLPLGYIWAYIDAVLNKTLNVNRPELHEQVIIGNTGIRDPQMSKINTVDKLINYALRQYPNSINRVKTILKTKGITTINQLNKGLFGRKNVISNLIKLGVPKEEATYINKSLFLLRTSKKITTRGKNGLLESYVNGGSLFDTMELAKTLFPDMKIGTTLDSNPDILYMTTAKSPSRIPGYVLSHASIIVSERLGGYGHMMTGFICNDMELIHDSEDNRFYKLDWTKGQSEINKLLRWGGILRTGRAYFVFLNEKLLNRPNTANMNANGMVGYMAIKTNNGGYLKNSNGKTIYMKVQKNAYGMWKKMNNNKYLKNNAGKFVSTRSTGNSAINNMRQRALRSARGY
jgi:hypothetical protein